MKAKIELKNVNIEFDNSSTSLKDIFTQTKKLSVKPKDGLKNISIEILQGDRVGVIGRNGAGKSTLLRVIAGIYTPDSGAVSITGKIAPLIELGVGFNGEMTGEENVMLSGVLMGATRNEMKRKIDEIFDFAELSEYRHTPLKYYSTGMGMRLSFSLATSIDPEILILDEVFAGGDSSFVKKASGRMNEKINNAKIVLMVSHDMNLIKSICNRIIWLEKGVVKKVGTVEELCSAYEA